MVKRGMAGFKRSAGRKSTGNRLLDLEAEGRLKASPRQRTPYCPNGETQRSTVLSSLLYDSDEESMPNAELEWRKD